MILAQITPNSTTCCDKKSFILVYRITTFQGIKKL
jgi:hypothetical protein